MSVVHPEVEVIAVIASRPPPTTSSPAPSSRRTGTRTLSRPAIGATANDSSVTGRKRSPAWTGL